MGSALLGVVLVIWSLLPIYNILQIALDPEEGEIEFTGNIWPPAPSLESFEVVITQADRYLAHFWRQFANSLHIGLLTMVLTVLISSLASFAVGPTRLGHGSWLSGTALLTYAVPASFLVFPFVRLAHWYGLSDSAWAVIAAQTTFALPFAILILQHHAKLIPIELDDSARIDGASAPQGYLRIYLPLMSPALLVVAIYALVLAWNDYLYQLVLLSSERQLTVAITQAQLFDDPDAAWNAMMAAAIIYVLPPIAIFFAAFRSFLRVKERAGPT